MARSIFCTSGTFATPSAFRILVSSQAVGGVLTLGLLIPLVAGQIDLSIGNITGLAAIATASAYADFHAPVWLAILVGTFGLGVVVAQQQTPTTKITPLMKQVIADFPGHEVTMITLDIPPGGGSLPHRHPGHHTFGYVLEGAYKIKVEAGPERILHKGESFYEAPGQLHAVSQNASTTEPAKVLVLQLVESGKPTTVPEK